MPRLALAFALLFAVLLIQPSASAAEFKIGGLTVTDAWARATPGTSKVGAAYLAVSADGQSADKLVGVATPVAERAEIHTHIEDNGVMQMRQLESLDIAAGGTRKLAPGGDHIMLMGLKAPLSEGETFPLTLTFEKAGALVVTVTVTGVGAMGAP